MSKESGFNPFSPVKDVAKVVQKEVSEQVATSILKATSKLLRRSGKETAANIAGTVDKLAKRTSRE